MANIRKIEGKNGVSYKITVTTGRDLGRKQVRHYKTWKPEPGMTEKQMEKASARVAADFEREIELGFQTDNRQTFAEYAEYVIAQKERAGCKYRTIERYRDLTQRIYPAIGHIKLIDLRPQHLNMLYSDLAKPGVTNRGDKAIACADLKGLLKEKKLTRSAVAEVTGCSATTVTAACQGKKITLATAEAIAKALGMKTNKLFITESGSGTLSAKTILEYHRLIRTILAQAEREMLVPYNAAAKAIPPKVTKKEVNYFQPEDVANILDALEKEPLKWRLITHLLIVTGARRGEIMGLRWEEVDFKANTIRIDSALQYSQNRGVYDTTTKTGKARTVYLPAETMAMLREYRREYLTLQMKNGDRWRGTGYIFTKDDGTPMNPDSITAWLRKFSDRTGLPHINPHAFRHTVASVLISNGTDVVTVSKQLGHANTATTEGIYGHIIEESKERAAGCIADALLRRERA